LHTSGLAPNWPPPHHATPPQPFGNVPLEEDRLEGIGKKFSGSIKQAVGKITGDTKTEAEGAAEKTAGKAQNTVGGVKAAVRDRL